MMRRRADSLLGHAALVGVLGAVAVLGAAGAALLVPACSSFGASDAPDSGADQQSADAAAPVPACIVSASPPQPATVCASCTADTIFPGTAVSLAVVSGRSLYAVVGSSIMSTDNLDVGQLAPYGSSTINGSPKSMGIDASFLYVGTTTENVRLSLTSPTHAKESLPELVASFESDVLLHVGDSELFQTSPSGLLVLQKTGSHAVPSSPPLADAGPFAFEGDVAYAAAANTAGALVLLDVTNTIGHGPLTPLVLGLAVQAGYAYVAESPANTTSTTISRLSIATTSQGTREALAKDDGAIEYLAIDADRLYWVANRSVVTGSKVVVTSDLCGGDARVLARGLRGDKVVALSFDATYVYLSTALPGPIQRVKK